MKIITLITTFFIGIFLVYKSVLTFMKRLGLKYDLDNIEKYIKFEPVDKDNEVKVLVEEMQVFLNEFVKSQLKNKIIITFLLFTSIIALMASYFIMNTVIAITLSIIFVICISLYFYKDTRFQTDKVIVNKYIQRIDYICADLPLVEIDSRITQVKQVNKNELKLEEKIRLRSIRTFTIACVIVLINFFVIYNIVWSALYP